MADRIGNAMNWLGGMMKNHASQAVVYASGDYEVTVQATVGPSQNTIDDATVAELSYLHRDFGITAADLVDAGGAQLEPQRGDTITATIAGVERVYQVMIDGHENFWSWTDSSETRRRIRGKMVG